MNDAVLLELARRWDLDAETPQVRAHDDNKISDAIENGQRQAKRECADTLRMLVSLLGVKN